MKTHPRYVSTIRLAAVPTAVGCSRVFTKHTLTQWGLLGLYDPAALIVSELVTNSVKASGVMNPAPTWDEMRDLNLVDVGVLGFADRVCIQVWDASPEPPVFADADPARDATGGRGLLLVDRLADRVGYFVPRQGGKVVWAELLLEGADRPLPRRVGRRRTTIDFPQADADLLRKVLAGLHKL